MPFTMPTGYQQNRQKHITATMVSSIIQSHSTYEASLKAKQTECTTVENERWMEA